MSGAEILGVLGLDIASTTGASFNHPTDTRPISITMSLPDVADHGDRLAKFEDWLCDLIEAHAPAVVAYEAPLIPHGNALLTRAHTVLLLIKLAGVAELVAARYGCRRMAVNVSTVKKFWTGHGRAEKDAMIARCAQLGWSCRNDHEADSAAVWAYAMSTLNKGWAPMATPLFAPGRRSA